MGIDVLHIIREDHPICLANELYMYELLYCILFEVEG